MKINNGILGNGQQLDLIIVGAGPSGIAASLAAMSHKLKFITLEQDSLGGTVSHYPRGKIVMTAPVDLPIIGKMHFKETTKEALMQLFIVFVMLLLLSMNLISC